jgi:hypothetical protein
VDFPIENGGSFHSYVNVYQRVTSGTNANIGGILMVNVTIYGIHGSYGVGLEDVQSSGFLICFVHRKQIGSWPGSSEKSQALGEQPMQLQYSRAFGAKDVLGDRCLPMLTHTQSG